MQRAVIVFNPASRNASGWTRMAAIVRSTSTPGWQIDLVATHGPGHAVHLAAQAAASGASVVFACGGDGTINEVVNGLVGTECALGVMRGGMGDVFAREVGIPRSPEAALQLLLQGQRRRFDLGLADGRYFLMMAGVGFDAGVVHSVPPRPKKLLGSTSYALWGAAVLARYRARDVLLRVDGEETKARLYWLLLENTRSYGGIIRVARDALADDGRLDAFIFESHSLFRLVRTATRIVTHRLDGADGVTFRRIQELEVMSPGLGVQVDGEYIGETPMRFSVAPAAIEVLLPAGRGGDLFSTGAQPATARNPS